MFSPLILIVDDNHANLQAMEALFKEQGYRLAKAVSGEDALEKVKNLDPDLVLLDVLMPDMDGFEVCRRLRATPAVAEVPIVMLTALTDEEAKLAGFESGADDFVSKPLDWVELSTRVRSIIRLNRYRRLVVERTRMEELIRLAPCGWVICDARGIVRLTNDRMVSLVPVQSHRSLIGMHFSTFFAVNERERVKAWLEDSGERPRIESVLAGLGTERHRPVELVAGHFEDDIHHFSQILITDITERRHLEGVQRDERFRALVKGATDIIATVDAQRIYSYVGPTAETVIGLQPEQMVGRDPLMWVHGDDRSRVEEAFDSVCSGAEKEVQIQYRHAHGDGSNRELSVTLRDAFDDPNVRAVVLNARDITEQKHLWGQLLQSQKMEIVGQLAGGVAHDFNNLMAVILNYAQFALEKLPEDNQAVPDILEIERASQRTIALTRQLLSFSRKQVYVPKQVRLSSMIDNMERLIRPLIGENILWNIEAEDDLCLVNIDPGQFEQLVINLIVNARDALGAGGEISISLQNRHVDRELLDATNAPVSPGPYASMSLRDDGCGMEPEVLEHLFEPFFTTKAPGEGTGLGMSTVYGIIKQEKGAIFVQSAPGEGTCFEVLFPSIIMEGEISEPHHTTNSARTPRQPLVGGTEEIVLLEDDEAVLEVVRRMLDNLGYEVHATSNAEEAIETCTRDGSTVSLLITDIVMPNTSGPEVAARIRAKCATLPCIFISGYSSDYLEDQDQIKDVYLLQKPFTPQMLATKIRKVLDKAAVPV